MRIQINDKEEIFPSSMCEITLGQQIDFHELHGRELDLMLADIKKMEDGVLKDAATNDYHHQKMIRTFSFFTGCTLEAIEGDGFLDQIFDIYHSCHAVVSHEQDELELNPPFFFKGEFWTIRAANDRMKMDDFLRSNSLVKNIHKFSNGHWQNLLLICCHLLEKNNDPRDVRFYDQFTMQGTNFDEVLNQIDDEGLQRLELMKELTMDIAMQVVIFLNNSMDLAIDITKDNKN